MRLFKYFLFVALGATFFVSCKKDQSQPSTAVNDDGCVVRNASTNGKLVDGQYIIIYSESSNAKALTSARQSSLSSSLLSKNSIAPTAVVQSFQGDRPGFIARMSTDDAARLRSDDRVSIVEQDRVVALGTCFTVAEPRLVTWPAKRIGYGDGTGKTAWIIDSGIDFDHPDLNVDVARSRSFLSGNNSAEDENGHGTHVAGIIGAKNNSIGILGIASGATLISLRVLDKDGEGLVSAIIQALAYVSVNGNAGDVINLSLGEDEISNALDQQVKNVASKGIYITIAAGNDNKPAINYSPGRANAPNVYTVSAIDSLDNFASFSNYGNDAVDVAAPGVRIVSTYLNGKYAIMSGTSMAAPHVAGLLLLRGNAMSTKGTAKNDPDGTPDPIAHY